MKTVSRYTPKTFTQLWLESIGISLVLFVAVVAYYYIRRGSFSVSLFNRATASEALLLIGISFIISTVCYFFDKFDAIIAYRKYLGLLGFYAALIHIFISVVLLQDRYPLNSWMSAHQATFIPGLIATILFFLMALISNTTAAKLLGGQRWRQMLRVGGYSAYFFVLIHLVIFRYEDWLSWWLKGEPTLPPFSLIGVSFMLLVYFARFVLMIALQKKRKQLRLL